MENRKYKNSGAVLSLEFQERIAKDYQQRGRLTKADASTLRAYLKETGRIRDFGDGSRYGVKDWHERTEAAIRSAINEEGDHGYGDYWRSGWLDCKTHVHETVSWRISWDGCLCTYLCEVICSDSSDNGGWGQEYVPRTGIEEDVIDSLKNGLERAWDKAIANKKFLTENERRER